MRLFGKILNEKYAGLKQLTLVTPVGPYDLNHSVERNERKGLIEGPALDMYIEDLANSGFNEIITICSHSHTTKETANKKGIYFRDINPFRSEADLSPRLGPFLYQTADNISRRNDYEEQIKKVTPFVNYLKEQFEDSMNDIYFTATDDGSEELTRQLAYSCKGHKEGVLGIIKERTEPGKVKILGLTSWSTANLNDLEGKTCVLADDRRLSGNTTELIARELKTEYGVGKVVALITHDMSYNKNIIEQKNIDNFIFLETHPNSPIKNIEDDRIYRFPLETTALLLASAIFDSYTNLRDRGGIKVR